jgi:hypothetical protein
MFVVVVSALVLVGVTAFITTDIYINRTFLAKRDFSRAFAARITGNCDTFCDYILRDLDKWRGKCAAEKILSTDPFYGFKVLKTTVRGESAFVQVELTRGIYKETYPVTYELKLTDGRWMINQNASN